MSEDIMSEEFNGTETLDVFSNSERIVAQKAVFIDGAVEIFQTVNTNETGRVILSPVAVVQLYEELKRRLKDG